MNKNTHISPLQTLHQLFPEEEWDIYRSKVPKNETPLWFYWSDFITRHLETGRSPRTIANVREAMRFVIRHLEIYSIEQCNDHRLLEDKLITEKVKRNQQGSTYNSILKNLKTYFIWLYKREYISENKLNKVLKCKTTQTEKIAYTEAQVRIIKDTISTHTQTPLQTLRNIVFIRLLALTGARPGELFNLKLSSFEKSSKGYVLKISGAKQVTKMRVYPISDIILIQSLEQYIAHRKKLERTEDSLFISSSKKGPWTQKGMRNLFRDISIKVGFKVTAYGFRRYVATDLHTKGVPIEKIAKYLGHSRLSTTMLYIQNSTSHTEEAMAILGSNLMNAFPRISPSVHSNKIDKS